VGIFSDFFTRCGISDGAGNNACKAANNPARNHDPKFPVAASASTAAGGAANYGKAIDFERGPIAAGFGSGFHPALDSRPTTPSITARRNRRGPNLGLALNFGLRFRHRRTRVPTLRSAQGIGGSVIGDRPIDGGRQWSVRTTGQWAEVTFNDGGFQPLAVATLEVESQASLRATISDCPGRRPPCMH